MLTFIQNYTFAKLKTVRKCHKKSHENIKERKTMADSSQKSIYT